MKKRFITSRPWKIKKNSAKLQSLRLVTFLKIYMDCLFTARSKNKQVSDSDCTHVYGDLYIESNFFMKGLNKQVA